MMQKIIILFIFIYSCQSKINKELTTTEKQKAEIFQVYKCDINEIVKLKKQLYIKIDYQLIKSFLSTISIECKNNVEFTQLANKVLFETLKISPKKFLKVVENEEVERSVIFEMIENPIDDRIDLKKIISKINQLNINNKYKIKIIESLTKALNKTNVPS